MALDHDDARIHMARTQMAFTGRYGLPVDAPRQNAGAGLTRDAAHSAAIGESIERYAGSAYDPEDFLLCSFEELPERGVPPASLAIFSPSQYASSGFGFRPPAPSTTLRWRRAFSLVDGEPVWYPAGLVHVPYRWAREEEPIGPSLSTGMAVGVTAAEALLTGLCEVVERDAVMTVWWSRLPAAEIVVEPDSWLGEVLAERFTVPNVAFRLFDVTTDVRIPTVLCVATEERDNGCAVALGAACRTDSASAALKALLEAAKGRHTQRWQTRLHGPLQIESYDRMTSLEENPRLYARHDMRPVLDFLLRGQRRVALSELPVVDGDDAAARLRACTAALTAAGCEPLAFDLTPPDVADCGLCAVKVAVPGMVDLNGWHSFQGRGQQRLYDVPRRLGYADGPLTEADLNSYPHPFP